jgi:A/G-specific adenine glycosylase
MASRKVQTFSDSLQPAFRGQLLAWYDAHARDLPWRESRDPYRVWLSEIMLQQTRVAAVIAHYHEFLRRFPTVEKLARAREASVLAAWSGLGYYRRARMLHAAAKAVVRERDGKFPVTAAGLRELPGVGRYTAAAIASIAFGEAVAVVDGNVERVLQRVSGRRLAGEEFWRAAEGLLDRGRPGDFNQAMMELGATVCTPRAPGCLTCPVVELCATRGEMPGLVKAAAQKKREIHYALDYRDGAVFLVQRARDARLMAGMWELPEAEGPPGAKARANGAGKIAALKALRHPKAKRGSSGRDASRRDASKREAVRSDDATVRPGIASMMRSSSDDAEACFTVRHSITVTDYTVRVWRMHAPVDAVGRWIRVDALERVALAGLARKILRKATIMAPIPKPRRVI